MTPAPSASHQLPRAENTPQTRHELVSPGSCPRPRDLPRPSFGGASSPPSTRAGRARQPSQRSSARLLPAPLQEGAATFPSPRPFAGAKLSTRRWFTLWRWPSVACSCGNTRSTANAAPTPPQRGAQMESVLSKPHGTKPGQFHSSGFCCWKRSHLNLQTPRAVGLWRPASGKRHTAAQLPFPPLQALERPCLTFEG